MGARKEKLGARKEDMGARKEKFGARKEKLGSGILESSGASVFPLLPLVTMNIRFMEDLMISVHG